MFKRCFLILLTASSAHASFSLRPSFSLGFEGGGDKVFEQAVSTGGTRGFNAGGLAVLTLGAEALHPISELPLKTRLAFGFKAAGAEAQDGKLDLFRWILELSEHYEFQALPLVIGGGVTWHFSNKLNATGVLVSQQGKVDPSLGIFAQVDYAFRPTQTEKFPISSASEYQIGLRYTVQKIHAVSTDRTYDANAIGFHFRSLW